MAKDSASEQKKGWSLARRKRHAKKTRIAKALGVSPRVPMALIEQEIKDSELDRKTLARKVKVAPRVKPSFSRDTPMEVSIGNLKLSGTAFEVMDFLIRRLG